MVSGARDGAGAQRPRRRRHRLRVVLAGPQRRWRTAASWRAGPPRPPGRSPAWSARASRRVAAVAALPGASSRHGHGRARGGTPAGPVPEDDPVLVRRRPVVERAERQRLQGPGPARVGPPAGLAVGVDLHRAGERDAVPPLEPDARPRTSRSPSTTPAVLVTRNCGSSYGPYCSTRKGRAATWPRRLPGPMYRVCASRSRVTIAGDREVELGVAEVGGPAAQQLELVHRVDRVRRPLGRQVGVGTAEHRDQGVEHLLALAAVEPPVVAPPAASDRAHRATAGARPRRPARDRSCSPSSAPSRRVVPGQAVQQAAVETACPPAPSASPRRGSATAAAGRGRRRGPWAARRPGPARSACPAPAAAAPRAGRAGRRRRASLACAFSISPFGSARTCSMRADDVRPLPAGAGSSACVSCSERSCPATEIVRDRLGRRLRSSAPACRSAGLPGDDDELARRARSRRPPRRTGWRARRRLSTRTSAIALGLQPPQLAVPGPGQHVARRGRHHRHQLARR